MIDKTEVERLREALESTDHPKIGEGEYAYAAIEQLPGMLREQAKDALFFECEPHVTIDAWQIVQMAADELEAAIAPRMAGEGYLVLAEQCADGIDQDHPDGTRERGSPRWASAYDGAMRAIGALTAAPSHPTPNDREAIRRNLDELQAAEATYRHAHDYYGRGDLRTGRAWDLMRRAGDAARAALAAPDQVRP